MQLQKAQLYIKTLFTELFTRCNVVKMSAYFNLNGTLQKLNWGDDINYWFLREIVDGTIVSYDWSWRTRYSNCSYIMGIGSLLTLVPLKNSIIWGSGVISSSAPFCGKPKEVRAVRGPLTRKRLLDAGIDCPKVYGDPALLLPRYYKPKVIKKFKIGIIPHYNDKNNSAFNKFKHESDILVIDIRNYNHWLDFINQICQCEAIVSTSLHGLIISEAYGIPNVWIKLQSNEFSDDIKYHDFFLSLGIDRSPFFFSEQTNRTELLEQIATYKKGTINLEPLIKACPFKLKENAIITY